jgi:glycosyltransferase involved in cell wall biosynthesis
MCHLKKEPALMKITILMPALNEEESIGLTIALIPTEKLNEMGYDPEIIIVDGGSTDKTAGTARLMGAEVISSGKGYGRQYRLGFANARGEIIVTADSDCSYPMEEIPELLNILANEKLDFISTNRFAFMDHDSMFPVNRFGNRVLTLIANLLFRFNLKDSQSGMWVFRKSILEKIALTSNGMSLSQEIKIKAFGNFRSREVDSSYRKRIGKVKLRIFLDGLDNLCHLFKLRICK